MASEEEATVYCICRQPYDGELFMIECDICKDWFHGNCVGIQEHQAVDIEIYHCPNCQIPHGPLVLKKRRNWHRHDYSELDDSVKAVQTGTVLFVQELKSRTFPTAEEMPVIRLQGHELTKAYLDEYGFDNPILVERKEGLNLKVPPPSFTIQDVENYVGSMREIDVIDVARQDDYKMLMREWTEYYSSPNRQKVYNVISLEFSKTKLSELVEPPQVVKDVSWVNNYWPKELPEDADYQKPEVQRYCLMGVKDSFTDFHIDFGGTSVWYHVLKGEKVFYMIRPTPTNLTLYESWVSSSSQSEMFFGDQADACYRVVVKQGQTIFVPTGWIHGVLTPIDSLVFGGNFLHSYNVDLQIQVFEIEKSVKTPDKYLYPNYETIHWYVTQHMYEELKGYLASGIPPPEKLVSNLRSLASSLKGWTHKKDLNRRVLYIKRDKIPDSIQYGKLLKDLTKDLKSLQKSPVRSPGRLRTKSTGDKKEGKKNDDVSARKKDGAITKKVDGEPAKKRAKKSKKVSPKEQEKIDLLHAATQIKLDAMNEENSSRLLDSKVAGSMLYTHTSPVAKVRPGSPTGQLGTVQTKPKGGNLKMRLPKAGAYMDMSVYDFKDEPDEEIPSPGMKSPLALSRSPKTSPLPKLTLGGMRSLPSTLKGALQSPVKSLSPGGTNNITPTVAGMTTPNGMPPVQLKLKVLNGKIVSGTSGDLSSAAADPVPSSLALQAPNNEVKSESEDSDDEDNLVVDENPQKKTQSNAGSLKLKLSIAPAGRLTAQSDCLLSTASPAGTSTMPLSGGLDASSFTTPMQRANMPTIRGGLNGSITDILEASGYGTETEFKVDDEMGYAKDVKRRASPSMRDAIQGMLSMSQMGGMSLTGAQPFDVKPKASLRLQGRAQRKFALDEDTGERMPTCFKDEEYVYPTLDLSDNEAEHVFKPRGRIKKDETWNPKAKLAPNCPKPERPHREGTRRESVESGLAAAAARLATQPPPKRQYIRKKPRTPKPSMSDFEGSGLGLLGDISDLTDLDNPQPGTSTTQLPSYSASAPASLLGITLGHKRPPPISSVKSAPKKPKKKGMATTKQRLGKILKLNKIFH